MKVRITKESKDDLCVEATRDSGTKPMILHFNARQIDEFTALMEAFKPQQLELFCKLLKTARNLDVFDFAMEVGNG